MRRRFMTQSGGMFPDSEAGDAILYNRTTGEFLCIKYDELAANRYNYSSYTYRPIGVVAIPARHNVYGTGECGIISPRGMYQYDPNNGGYDYDTEGDYTMIWGGKCYSLDLPNLAYVPLISSSMTSNDIVYTNFTGDLPGSHITGYNPTSGYGLDTQSRYKNSPYRQDYYCPSPYLENGERNPSYCNSTYSNMSRNCLNDFDGKGNTAYMLNYATDQSNWKTDEFIEESSISGCYTAACCCWRFHTEGTKQGDWYLPSAGEFGYVVARGQEIYDTLNTLASIFGSQYVIGLKLDSSYWTSTKYNSDQVRIIYTSTGTVSLRVPYEYTHPCRAFLRL